MNIKTLPLFFLCIFSLNAQHERRCALDIGSGWIKMQMATVDTTSNQIIQLIDTPHRFYVPLANHFAQHGTLNDTIQTEAYNAFEQIISLCHTHKITRIAGVATEIFRTAGKSGQQLFKKLQAQAARYCGEQQVHLRIISQQEEGILGFLTAAALTPEYSESDIISWDSGNASFQLVMKDTAQYVSIQEPLGSARAAELFVTAIRNQPYTIGKQISPILPEEVDAFTNLVAHMIDLPNHYKQNGTNREIICIGGPTSMFALATRIANKRSITQEDVHASVNQYTKLQQSDPQIIELDPIEPETVITRLLLLYAVMKTLEIKHITYKACAGNTQGILAHPTLWK